MVSLDLGALGTVVPRKCLSLLYGHRFFYTSSPCSSVFSYEREPPLRSSNKIGLRAVSSSRGKRLIACKTFMPVDIGEPLREPHWTLRTSFVASGITISYANQG
ncbi:uncharacterized protein LOC143153933 isoform X1 [Ptiloglossa arizonensis]|uniref:uncharacterized protein LOC143153933 isoform X1 n=1 Tax=Ptiloglossa arizonensis TaxID=3350558 RepID=UPI003FA0E42F